MRTPEVEAAMAWAVLAYNGDTIGEAAAELLRSLAIPDIDQFSDNTERQHDGALRTLAAEVERLEKENFTLQWEPTKLKTCVETAERRVKELEANEDCLTQIRRWMSSGWLIYARDPAVPVLQCKPDGRHWEDGLIFASVDSYVHKSEVAELERWENRYRVCAEERLALTTQLNLELLPKVAELEAQNARLRALAFELASSLGACAGYIASVRTDRQITQDENVYALQTLEWAEGAVEVAQYANAALEAYDKALNGEEASK